MLVGKAVFRRSLATVWTIAAIIYIFAATYAPIRNERVADTVIGFLLGTCIATIISFYFGKVEDEQKEK